MEEADTPLVLVVFVKSTESLDSLFPPSCISVVFEIKRCLIQFRITFGVGGWEKKSGVPRQRQARGESGRLTSIVLLGLYRLSPRTMGA